MKAITIHQPWAWAIAQGIKPVENRTWRTDYRGELAVHAGVSRISLRRGREVLEHLGILVPPDDALVFGAIVGLVDLVDSLPVEQAPSGPFRAGPMCWLLRHSRQIAPVPCKGQLGLFTLRDEVVAQITRRR